MSDKLIQNIGPNVYSNDQFIAFNSGYYMNMPASEADALTTQYNQMGTAYTFATHYTFETYYSVNSSAVTVASGNTLAYGQTDAIGPTAALGTVVLTEVDPTLYWTEFCQNAAASGVIPYYDQFNTVHGATNLNLLAETLVSANPPLDPNR